MRNLPLRNVASTSYAAVPAPDAGERVVACGRFLWPRNLLVVLLLFILHEGFYLLPEKFVVIPGTFRMIDGIFVILPLFFLFAFPSALRLFHRFGEETLLVLAACAMVLLSPLMALFFFGQPYETGLMLMRHNLAYLVFFIFVFLMGPLDRVEQLLRLLTFLVGAYVVILVLTKYNHRLDLIQYREGYYDDTGGGFTRFGESRLFFPYANLPILLYCISLGRLLRTPAMGGSLRKKIPDLGFVLLVLYAVLATYTRILVFSLLVVTGYALLTSKRRSLRNAAMVLAVLVIGFEVLAVAAGSRISFLENSRLGRMALQSGTLAPESGRQFQMAMYANNFVKSPLTGVGNIASGKLDAARTSYLRIYRKYGLFNTTDIGYMKMAAENGLAGLAWVIWLYMYMYRRSRQVLTEAAAIGGQPAAEAVARGLRYFLVYLAISGVTLPHFVAGSGIPVVVLAVALMAITRESLSRRAVTAA